MWVVTGGNVSRKVVIDSGISAEGHADVEHLLLQDMQELHVVDWFPKQPQPPLTRSWLRSTCCTCICFASSQQRCCYGHICAATLQRLQG